jgi:hypothetical protein
MTTLVFDTLQYANKLKAAGVPDKQAEVQAEAMAEIVEEKLSSKTDLKLVEDNLTKTINNTRHELELKIAELKAEIIKWVLGVSVAQAAIIISCIKLIH